LFTSFGNYLYQPVHELPDIRWRDLGQHISSIIPLEQNETIIAAIGLENFEEEANIITVSKNGMIKQSSLGVFEIRRYNRTYRAMGIRKGDEMVDARLVKGDEDVILFTKQAFALRFPLDELSVTGVRTAGVRGINLKDDDQLVSMVAVRGEENASLVLATQRGAAKRMNLREFEPAKRAQRGVVVLRVLQSNPHEVIGVEMAVNDEIIVLATDKNHKIPILAGSLRLVDRYSNGSFIADEKKDGRVTHIYKDPKAELE
jgi:topoisomerase IV subunit A